MCLAFIELNHKPILAALPFLDGLVNHAVERFNRIRSVDSLTDIFRVVEWRVEIFDNGVAICFVCILFLRGMLSYLPV